MTLISKLKSIFCFVSVFLFASSATAHWTLDNDASTLSFVTVKADHVGEVHTFDQLSGDINDDGSVQITIELASVNTLIDIRNERMQNMLFETNLFPQAIISGAIDLDAVADMDAGDTAHVEFKQSGGTAQVDVDSGNPGATPPQLDTFFSGYLLG